MDKKILGLPISIFVLGFILSIFASIPNLYVYHKLSEKVDKVDLQAYQKCSLVPILAPSEASKSASPSGKVK